MTAWAQRFRDHFSATIIADAAFRVGVELGVPAPGLRPMRGGDRLAGPVTTVELNNDLPTIIAAVHSADAGTVVVVVNASPDVAVIGDLIASEAARRHLGGIVADCPVRDTAELATIDVPVFSRGAAVVGPLKVPPSERGMGRRDVPIIVGEATVEPGAWAFGDDDGVVFLAEADLPAVFERAEEAVAGEAALAERIADGGGLGEALGIEDYLAERENDPAASFADHIANRGLAI